MRDRLTEALKVRDVEYVDIRLEDKTNTWVNFRGPDLDTIGSARTVGGIVRALEKGGWGYATFNDLDDLSKRVREACETARLVGTGTSYFAPSEPIVDTIKATLIKDFRQVPLAEKKSLAEEYNRIILGHHKNIQSSSVRYGDSYKKIWFASSEGSYIEEELPDIYMVTAAVAVKGISYRPFLNPTVGLLDMRKSKTFTIAPRQRLRKQSIYWLLRRLQEASTLPSLTRF